MSFALQQFFLPDEAAFSHWVQREELRSSSKRKNDLYFFPSWPCSFALGKAALVQSTVDIIYLAFPLLVL